MAEQPRAGITRCQRHTVLNYHSTVTVPCLSHMMPEQPSSQAAQCQHSLVLEPCSVESAQCRSHVVLNQPSAIAVLCWSHTVPQQPGAGIAWCCSCTVPEPHSVEPALCQSHVVLNQPGAIAVPCWSRTVPELHGAGVALYESSPVPDLASQCHYLLEEEVVDEVDRCQVGEGVAGCRGSGRVLWWGPLGARARRFFHIRLLPPTQVLRAGVCQGGGEPPPHPEPAPGTPSPGTGTPNPGDRDRIQPLPEKPESFSTLLAWGACAPHSSPVFFRGTTEWRGSVATPGTSGSAGIRVAPPAGGHRDPGGGVLGAHGDWGRAVGGPTPGESGQVTAVVG